MNPNPTGPKLLFQQRLGCQSWKQDRKLRTVTSVAEIRKGMLAGSRAAGEDEVVTSL